MNSKKVEKEMKRFGIDGFHVHVHMDGLPEQIARLDDIKVINSFDNLGKPLNILQIDVTALNEQGLLDNFDCKPFGIEFPKKDRNKNERKKKC
jgi:hypothetical protein|tara:strand:+ start:627 stop:905 length:279 start_codon:yes stop_codon:yes gene_type:complete